MGATRVFVSFDAEHDGDLCERLVAQSGEAGLSITVSGSSEPFRGMGDWVERTRRRIREADRVVVLCGEHTENSLGAAEELRIIEEEGKPYLLLWGRRDLMCTKPSGAKATKSMYTWTSQTILEQFELISRVEQREAAAAGMKRPVPQPTDDQPPAS